MWGAWSYTIDGIDALAAQSWSKGTMGTYCTQCRKLYMWFGISPMGHLDMEACRYLWFQWG